MKRYLNTDELIIVNVVPDEWDKWFRTLDYIRALPEADLEVW